MTYKITYQGEIVSTNKIYSAKHWGARSAAKTKYRDIFSVLLLEAKVKPFSEFKLSLQYKNGMDIDNLSIMAKFFADTLKGKYVEDDTPKYFKSLTISYNENLPKNTIEFLLDVKE